jgi:PPM family protein phosphatase
VTGLIEKLFPPKKRKSSEVDTIPMLEKPVLPKPVQTEETIEVGHAEYPQIIAACSQSVGKQRDHNEDALFTLTTNLVSDTRDIPFGLYIVADGMGGHQHGEVASAMAIRVMAGHVIRKIYLPLFSLTAKAPEQSLQEIMQEGVLEAHRSINKAALGGGTTLTAALIMGDQMTIAHVGDSRAYAIQGDGKMEVLTTDHSLVKRLEELGQITAEEAANHPQRNVLYRALGQGEPFDPEIITAPAPHGGYLLMCSDGLWGVMPQERLYEITSTSPSPYQACQRLVEAANRAGGPDNITAIIVKMPG